MTECVLYLLNLLKEKGFHSRYVEGYMLYISWNIQKQEYKTLEDIKKPPPTLENIHLKYKPIENNNFKNFIPRKKNR